MEEPAGFLRAGEMFWKVPPEEARSVLGVLPVVHLLPLDLQPGDAVSGKRLAGGL